MAEDRPDIKKHVELKGKQTQTHKSPREIKREVREASVKRRVHASD